MKLSKFLLDRRTAHVTRWHHRPCLMVESIATHQALTARIAYFVAVLGHQRGAFNYAVDSHLVTIAALFHDEPEIITGDHPGNQKQQHEGLREALADVEALGIDLLIAEAPESVRNGYASVLQASFLNTEEAQVLRYADDLAALAFLDDEIRMGNRQESVRDTHLSILKTISERDWPWLLALRLEEDLP